MQRSDDRVRVSVQVTDAPAGRVPWSDQYDHALDGSFALQDEITARIVTALDVKLASGEQARVWHKCLTDPKALECFYRGIQAFVRMNQESIANARTCFLRLTELAPASPFGPTWTALCLWFESTRGWAADPVEAREQAGTWAERAVAMDDADGQAHTVLGNVRLLQRRFDEALASRTRHWKFGRAVRMPMDFLRTSSFTAANRIGLSCTPGARSVTCPFILRGLSIFLRPRIAMPECPIWRSSPREKLCASRPRLFKRGLRLQARCSCGWPADGRRVVGEARELDANLASPSGPRRNPIEMRTP